MAERTHYHRTRPYSEQELYSALVSYLSENFIFVRLEIDSWLGNEQVLLKHTDARFRADYLFGKSGEELWSDGAFEDWQVCTPSTLKSIRSEFLLKNGQLAGKNRKKLISEIISAETTNGSMIKVVRFNPLLKQLIEKGRQKVSGIKPLVQGSNKRVKVTLNEGDTCYFCWNTKKPYVANPAYVFKKVGSSYILIFFTNQSNGTETSKPGINMGRFINAPADEVGLTPQQAVLQQFC